MDLSKFWKKSEPDHIDSNSTNDGGYTMSFTFRFSNHTNPHPIRRGHNSVHSPKKSRAKKNSKWNGSYEAKYEKHENESGEGPGQPRSYTISSNGSDTQMTSVLGNLANISPTRPNTLKISTGKIQKLRNFERVHQPVALLEANPVSREGNCNKWSLGTSLKGGGRYCYA